MVIARFQFKPEHADQFCWRAGQTVTEVLFDSVMELIEFCQEVEDAIEDCTVFTGSDIISLKSFVC